MADNRVTKSAVLQNERAKWTDDSSLEPDNVHRFATSH